MVRLLVLTQLAFNVGFFMVLPYLSVHLTSDLGQAAAVVGAILGLRTVAQQGMFFVGGTIADRIGTRRTVLVGCAVRVSGLVCLGISTSVLGAAIGAVLTGFAGALFSPAVEAELARSSDTDDASHARIDAFALFNAFGQIGAFTGPLLGALLLNVDFRTVAFTGAAVFVLIGAAQWRWLPAHRPPPTRGSVLSGWRDIARNRVFLCFSLAVGVSLVAYNQLYLLVPIELDRGWGDQEPLGVLLAASSLVVVIAQMRVTAWARRRSPTRAMTLGLGSVALGLVAVGTAAAVGSRPATLIGALLFVLLLAMGQMITGPTARAAIPGFAREQHLGSYYGVYASIGGILVLPASAAVGAVVDAVPDTALGRAAPWGLLAGLVLVAAASLGPIMRRQDRRGQTAAHP
ncbi:MFS transporter [Gordonia sp. NB41Y]|uniref:MDR family MFS transporter n=1 Tax=Gordonia sp. NB41Y TaxID=875808 RepID=UPI0021C746E4|nr:MFS transporter [Gordonia sp. NB41Y]WLP90696.1 MFS transporter [Gordonia sp. NB41Y]